MRDRSRLYKAFVQAWTALVAEGIVRDDPTLMIEAWIQFGVEERAGFPTAFDNLIPAVEPALLFRPICSKKS
jgi:hypothetical protein